MNAILFKVVMGAMLLCCVAAIAGENGKSIQNERVPGRDNWFDDIELTAGQVVDIRVSGDGDSDLDLFLYYVPNGLISLLADDDWILVGRSRGYDDQERIRGRVVNGGSYVIVVENLGRFYNDFRLSIEVK